MKKLLASALSMVLLLSVLTIPAAAKEGYTYKPFTITGINGATYSFSAACTGYGISCDYQEGSVEFDAAVILKEGSTVSVTEGHTEDNGFMFMGIQSRNVVGDFMSVDCQSYYGSTVAVEEMYRSSCSWLEYEMKDALGYIITPQKQRVVIFLENTAEAHRDMISYPGPVIDNTPAKPVETTKTNPDIYIYDQALDEPLGYTVTNNTGKQLTAHYALLSYWPKTRYYPATEISPHESEFFYGQLLSLDLDLAPGESMKGECWGVTVGWSTMTHCWIQFDDKAERDAFFRNNALRLGPGADRTGKNTYEIDNGDAGTRWMKDVLGIAIQSGKK